MRDLDNNRANKNIDDIVNSIYDAMDINGVKYVNDNPSFVADLVNYSAYENGVDADIILRKMGINPKEFWEE